MESTWSDSAVAEKCESAGFISIKLKANRLESSCIKKQRPKKQNKKKITEKEL